MSNVKFKEIQDALTAKEPEQAIDYLGKLDTESQNTPRALLAFFRAKLQLRSFDEARTFLDRAEAAGAHAKTVLVWRATLEKAAGNFSDALPLYEQLASSDDVKLNHLLQLAQIYYKLKRLGDAKKTASRVALANEPLPAVFNLLFSIAWHENDEAGALKSIDDAIKAGVAFPGFPQLHQLLTFQSTHQANETVRKVANAWSEDTEIDDTSFRLKLIKKLDKQQPQQLFDRALQFALSGQLGQAKEIIKTSNLPPNGITLGIKNSELEKFFELLPKPEARQRPIVKDDGSELLVSDKTASGITVVVFTGLADKVMVNIPVLDAYFAKLGYAAIYLRDFERKLYLNGISSLAPDRSGTLSVIEDKLARLNTKRVICYGSSGGSFGALRYGIELQAEKIICFSGITNIQLPFLPMSIPHNTRGFLKRMNKLFSDVELDTLPWIQSARVKPPIDLWYCEHSEIDCLHAEHLKPLPQVQLHKVLNNDTHNSVVPVIMSGEIENALRLEK